MHNVVTVFYETFMSLTVFHIDFLQTDIHTLTVAKWITSFRSNLRYLST